MTNENEKWNQADRNLHIDEDGYLYTGKKLNETFKSNSRFKVHVGECNGLEIYERSSQNDTLITIDPYLYPDKDENITYMEAVVHLCSYTSVMYPIRNAIETISKETLSYDPRGHEDYLILKGKVKDIVKKAPTSFLDKATDMVIDALTPLLKDDDIEEFE